MLMIYSKFKNKLYDVTYMWKIGGKRTKMDFFYKTKIRLTDRKQTYGHQNGREDRDKMGVWD